jgi:hypothetical protein
MLCKEHALCPAALQMYSAAVADYRHPHQQETGSRAGQISVLVIDSTVIYLSLLLNQELLRPCY